MVCDVDTVLNSLHIRETTIVLKKIRFSISIQSRILQEYDNIKNFLMMDSMEIRKL